MAAVLPVLGTMKRDWMKEPRAFTMSLNTLVECCFISYDWQNELKKENNTEFKKNKTCQLTYQRIKQEKSKFRTFQTVLGSDFA